MKLLRAFFVLALVAGGCLTIRSVYLHAKAKLASVLIHRAWDERVSFGTTRPPWPWADTHPVARLRIPRLSYDEIVLEGATLRTMAFGPARLLSGANFGEPGNLQLAGHRTSWFRPLEAVTVGDTIEVQWFDDRRQQLRQRTYRVNAIQVVLPEDTALLAASFDDQLTLVTCYPFGRSPRSPQRYVVRASPINTQVRSVGMLHLVPEMAELSRLRLLPAHHGIARFADRSESCPDARTNYEE